MRWLSGRAAVWCLLAAGATLAGCSDDGAPDAQSPQQTSPTQSPNPTDAAPTPAATGPELPRSCGQLVDYMTVLDAVGGTLEGETTFVYAGPLASGRTGRITCGYGVAPGPDGQPGPPRVEVTLNGYDTPQTARFRFDFTIDRAREEAQRIESIDFDGRPAVLLSDAEDSSLIVLDDDKTLVVSVLQGVVPDPAVKAATFDIAAAVLALPQETPPDE